MLRFTCLALLVSLAVGLELKAQIKDHWQSFKSAHKKSYSSGEEDQRQEVFKKNVEKVLQHNLKSDLGESTSQLGINEWSDLTKEEFEKTMMGWIDTGNKTAPRYAPRPQVRANIPASIDYRNLNAVNPIKSQAQCGSCWAFLTVSALESHYALATGNLNSLSPQNLIDCSKSPPNNGCKGGNVNVAFDFIIRNGGLDLENCYPYQMRDDVCTFNRNCIGATMEAYADVISGDEYDLQETVATKGPVAIAIDAHHDEFRFHKVGVINIPGCSTTKPTHGVLVIGYGTEDGQDYWLIRNSWGATWGQGGYGKLARNAGNMCGVATSASYPIIKL